MVSQTTSLSLVTLLHHLPEALREQILLQAGPQATANLSLTCIDLFSLIQPDDTLWKLFALSTFGHTRDLRHLDASPLWHRAKSHCKLLHPERECGCWYFRYWAARKYVCSYCGGWEWDQRGGIEDGKGVVCAACCAKIASWNRLYEV